MKLVPLETMVAMEEVKKTIALLVLLICLKQGWSAVPIGVNYGRMGDDLPSPTQTAELLINQGIKKVKLYDAEPTVISAFANTGIQVTISMYNEVIWALALGKDEAAGWLRSNVLPHWPATNITQILVGNEILTRGDHGLANVLVPALRNLHSALVEVGLSSIKLTTPHAMDVLDMATSFPPSSGSFQSSLNSTVMKPLLDFLSQTGAPFMIDAYPYFAYRDDKGKHIELAYALLDKNAKGVKDWGTGLYYYNMLDAQIDAIYAAMQKLGHDNIPVVVAETGWPSVGDALGAGIENAGSFARNLISKMLADPPLGTPNKPQFPIQAYLFALYNENQKQGGTAERNFGLFYPNMTSVYPLKS